MSDHDSQELQDLFDQIASQAPASAALAVVELPVDTPQNIKEPEPPLETNEMYKSIGHLVRRLHDALREVGQETMLFKVGETLPESKERLLFIGDLMEKSATQCVQLTEQEMPKLESNIDQLKSCQAGWVKVVAGHSSLDEFKALAQATPDILGTAISVEKQAKNSLMEILMAQGFQDLAGQTLGKIMAQVSTLERELLELLALSAIDHQGKEKISDFLEGPQFKKTDDAVHNQQEVDDLLKDLGF
jgi:chemotaxis protein CheZ